MDHARAVLAGARPHWARNKLCSCRARAVCLVPHSYFTLSRPSLRRACWGAQPACRSGRNRHCLAALPSNRVPKVTWAIDLFAIEIYVVVAALSVEVFCRLVDSALAENRRQFRRMRALPKASSNLHRLATARRGCGPRLTTRRLASHTSHDGRWLSVNGPLCRNSRLLGR
jgi:hypothetical protein